MNNRVTLSLVFLLSAVGSSFSSQAFKGGLTKKTDLIIIGTQTNNNQRSKKRPHSADEQKKRPTRKEIQADRDAKRRLERSFIDDNSITGPMDWSNNR